MAALLFAQVALAAFACPMDFAAEPAAATMEGCPGMDGGAPTPLCSTHCADAAQSVEKPVVPYVAPAVLIGEVHWDPLHGVASRVPASSPRHSPGSTRAIPPPEPPLSVLHCRLRI
jgi:hypothetical protein